MTKRRKTEIFMNFLTNAESKIVYEVGEITGAGQTKFHTDMIENVISLNEITNEYRVTFDPGYENAFEVHMGDNIF